MLLTQTVSTNAGGCDNNNICRNTRQISYQNCLFYCFYFYVVMNSSTHISYAFYYTNILNGIFFSPYNCFFFFKRIVLGCFLFFMTPSALSSYRFFSLALQSPKLIFLNPSRTTSYRVLSITYPLPLF